ncbi:MAG: FtsX-like permease family protein, partial [Betaproteobacteria bacterium]|nr:FtsX-like permease family protein [Betaproteobacteria bacterium]
MRALFFRLLARDFRAGQLSLLGLALAVSVFAMTTVLSLADRFERSLQSRAASLLAADVLLVSDRPIQPELLEQAKAQGLGVMQTAVFPAMVSVGEQTMLASIKAVSSSYPLRGRLELQGLWQQASGVDRTLDRPPPAVEPVPTDPAILKRWVAKKELTLEKGQRIETQEAGRPEIQLTMQRARGFLGLIASVIAIVACAAIALASRHYANSHQRQYAVMRVMGASAAYLFGVVVLQFITLGLFAGGIGAMLGVYAGDWLASLIPVKLAQQLPPADIAIALQALAAGMLMLFCFSLGGWLQLLGVTPNVLFRDQTPGQIFQAQSHRKILAMFRSSLPWLVMILACLGLSVWLSDSLRSALWLWSGLILVLCLLALLLAVFYQIARTTGESLPASYLAAKLAFRRLGRT